MQDELFEDIIAHLNGNKIEELELSNKKLTREQIKKLAAAIRKNTSLYSLYLRGDKLTVEDLKEILDAIKSFPFFDNLHLRHTKINDEGVRVIANALLENIPIRAIDLSYNKITGESTQCLADATSKNTWLKSLNLRGNYIGCQGIYDLCQSLKNNKGLTQLDISENIYITNIAFEGVIDLLTHNTTLKEININHASIPEKLIFKIAKALNTSAIEKISLNIENDETRKRFNELAQGNSKPKDISDGMPRIMNILDFYSYQISFRYSFNKDDVDYINALCFYHSWFRIYRINGIIILRDTLTNIKELLKAIAPNNQGQYIIECTTHDALSTVGKVLPKINRTLLSELYKTLNTAQELKIGLALDEIKKYLLTCAEALNHTNISKPACPKLPNLNMLEAYCLLWEIKKNSSFQTKGACHLPEFQCIFFHFSENNFILSYGKQTQLDIMEPIVFHVAKGFIPFDNESQDIDHPVILALQKFHALWKKNKLKGPVVPDELSGFDAILKERARTVARQIGRGLQQPASFFYHMQPEIAARTITYSLPYQIADEEELSKVAQHHFGRPTA